MNAVVSISENFTVEDIHKIREMHCEEYAGLSPNEIAKKINDQTEEIKSRIRRDGIIVR